MYFSATILHTKIDTVYTINFKVSFPLIISIYDLKILLKYPDFKEFTSTFTIFNLQFCEINIA